MGSMAMHPVVTYTLLITVLSAQSLDHASLQSNASNTSTMGIASTSANVSGGLTNSSTVVMVPTPQDGLGSTTGSSGRCSDHDKELILKAGSGNADGTFPKILSVCAGRAYSWFSFHPDRMTRCTKDWLHISESCAQCFTPAAKYGADHCKSKCWSKWCSHSCLSCTDSASAHAPSCAGFTTPKASQC